MEASADAESVHPRPCCIASTNYLDGSVPVEIVSEPLPLDGRHNFIKAALWSSDGTCLITSTEQNELTAYVLPVDLLQNEHKHFLAPYSTVQCPEPIYSMVSYPGFNLQDPSTTLILSCVRDHPIRLTSILYKLPSSPPLLASYPLVCPTTEKYITPHSILWTQNGTHFVTGSDSLVCVFDIARQGQGPAERHPTIPSKRKNIVGGGVGMKGIVSALGMSAEGVLAAGTFTRCIGLYASEGHGECIAVFSIASAEEESTVSEGSGVTQLLWSPCSRYLYVVERKSDGIIVYDIRVAGKKLGSLCGRNAMTNQRLGTDIVRTASGHEVWAGGMDGIVRVWDSPGLKEGPREPAWEWDAHGGMIPIIASEAGVLLI
ncbi:MAG: hypothetical protein M1829_001323 [Trizodia sp. TS-e1964]|nr:MAG: hypothetical protein M1829_001323 [Trizodia sp. TS-e1964]